LLEKAAEYGSVTVLLNSDGGVYKLKGYLAEPYTQRKKNLLDTGLVKRVMSFFTDPTALIQHLRPAYLIAGSDHSKEAILNKGGLYAGEIIVLPYTEGICSTDLYKESLK